MEVFIPWERSLSNDEFDVIPPLIIPDGSYSLSPGGFLIGNPYIESLLLGKFNLNLGEVILLVDIGLICISSWLIVVHYELNSSSLMLLVAHLLRSSLKDGFKFECWCSLLLGNLGEGAREPRLSEGTENWGWRVSFYLVSSSFISFKVYLSSSFSRVLLNEFNLLIKLLFVSERISFNLEFIVESSEQELESL